MEVETQERYHPLDHIHNLEFDTECLGRNFGDSKWRRYFFMLLACWIFTLTLLTKCFDEIRWNTPQRLYYTSSIREPFYSPASFHVVYEDREVMNDLDSSKFRGPPRSELEKAWHDLLEGTLIRVSKEELEASNQTSVALQSGGYGVGLGVSHSLHCLNRIHRYLRRSYYYDDVQYDPVELEEHVDHCIDALRQAVTCQVDITLYPLVWTPRSQLQPGLRMPHARSCVNFKLLHKWMLERAVSMDDLVRPPDTFFEPQ